MMPMMVYQPPRNFDLAFSFTCPICSNPTQMTEAVEYEGPVNETGADTKHGHAAFCSMKCLLVILQPWSRA